MKNGGLPVQSIAPNFEVLVPVVPAMLVIHENETRVDEPPPHGAIGMSTAERISDVHPLLRTMAISKRVLHPGAALGLAMA
jgi:hypothetical protein